jgi:hypothetical protein
MMVLRRQKAVADSAFITFADGVSTGHRAGRVQ